VKFAAAHELVARSANRVNAEIAFWKSLLTAITARRRRSFEALLIDDFRDDILVSKTAATFLHYIYS
jgi:hypothetical protein